MRKSSKKSSKKKVSKKVKARRKPASKKTAKKKAPVKKEKKVQKRGRPKGSKNQKTLEKEAEIKRLKKLGLYKEEKPKQRGRPKGSKNRKTLEKERLAKLDAMDNYEDSLVGVNENPDTAIDDDQEVTICFGTPDLDDLPPPSEIRTYKFLGFCPGCNFGISTADLTDARSIKNGSYSCPSCKRRGKVKKLCTESSADKSDIKPKKTYIKRSASTSFEQHTNEERNLQDILEKHIRSNGYLDTDL